MSMTVIFSDFGDTDTQVLAHLWENIPDINLVHITRNTRNAYNKIKQALAVEKDTLLLCGHGTPGGLMSPSWDILVGENELRYIRAKRVIGIWCYAAQFAESIGLKGFFSSMFVSNESEAKLVSCLNSSAEVITREEILFCDRVNKLLLENIPLEKWRGLLLDQADMSIDVVKFNYNGLKFFS